MVLTVRDSYSRATTSIIGGKEAVLSGIVSSRVTLRALCNKMIPRVTSHGRVRGVGRMVRRTLTSTSMALSSLSTVNIACNPKLMNTLLINITRTGTVTCTGGLPLMKIRRVRNRISTGCVRRPSLRPPFLYLVISKKRARLIVIGSCKRFRVLKHAHSSTTNRTFSGITETVKLKCPKKPGMSGLSGRKGPGTVRFPGTGVKSYPCSFDFDNMGSTILGCVGRTRVAKRRVGETSLTTSFRGTMISILIRRAVLTTGSCKVAGVTVTNKITSGKALETTVRRTYGGGGCDFCQPSPVFYASGTTVVKMTTCCRCVGNAHRN